MKKQLFAYLVLLVLFFQAHKNYAQCGVGQSLVTIQLTTDNFPSETSWDLKDNNGTTLAVNGTLTAASTTTTTVCVNSGSCLTFTMHDSYGDGICCNYGAGSYTLLLNGVTVVTGGSFLHTDATSFNCAPGMVCTTAFLADTGNFVAPFNSTWYTFTPTQNGMYSLSTCDTANHCDTRVWVYDKCNGIVVTVGNSSTILYDDNAGGCGQLAALTAALDTTHTYYIRIGGDTTCNNDSVHWALHYNGPIMGCTDVNACNYNPTAGADDGSCMYPPNPLCPSPDLTIIQSEVQSSMYLDQIDANTDLCAVTESCLNGYGMRTIIRFDSHIKNIGNTDYYIGSPTLNPTQFTFNNCHNHAHYEGYAEYMLYNTSGQSVPIGFKNGFCVLDYDGCPDGGIAKFSCSNMGITAHCGDIYSAGLQCQWIDITDVDPGSYIMAVKINWDQSPDALGHYEMNYVNNWAQVCITIYIDNFGNKTYSLNGSCAPYVDCAGVQYGNSVKDCNGNCAGTTKMGDLDNNNLQQVADGQNYVTSILNSAITPSTCNDLNNDTLITVWDAALITNCAKHGTSFNTKCLFPHGVLNPTQTVTLSIGAINTVQNYVDIYMLSPATNVMAYEFDLSGLNILNVQSLIPASDYPSSPDFIVGGNKVISMSYIDSTISKFNVATPLCRVYYSSLTGSQVCISKIVHIVNKNYEAVHTTITNGCINTTGVESKVIDTENYFIVSPNPNSGLMTIAPHFNASEKATLTVCNMIGETVLTQQLNVSDNKPFQLSLNGIENGVYYIKIKTAEANVLQKIVVSK